MPLRMVTPLIREALRCHLTRLSSTDEAERYEAQPLTESELSLAGAADWGPVENWSDWIDALR